MKQPAGALEPVFIVAVPAVSVPATELVPPDPSAEPFDRLGALPSELICLLSTRSLFRVKVSTAKVPADSRPLTVTLPVTVSEF